MARLTDASVKAIKAPEIGRAEYPDDLITGLRLRVGAGGRKAWIIRTRAAGKPINKKIGSYPIMGLGDAREQAKKLLLEVQQSGVPRTKRTFGMLADRWLEKVAKPNNKSWVMQKRRLEIHVMPDWRHRQLDSIRRADVRELIDHIEGDVAPNRVLTLVRTLFRYAIAQDWLDASPAEGIGKPKEEAPRDRFLSMIEAATVYRATDMLGYPWAGYFKLLLLTGQRRTEVAAMRWDELDLMEGSWLLASAATKSSRSHLVPLSSEALAILRSTPRLGDYVWTSDGRTHVKGYAKAKATLDRLLGAGGDDALKPWRLHDLRRTAATHMVRLGVTETIVARVLNHAPQGITARTYALHSYEPEKRHALEVWGAEIVCARTGGSPM